MRLKLRKRKVAILSSLGPISNLLDVTVDGVCSSDLN